MSSSNLGRFELPKLAPLDSLTAGTDIPPPPDSPIEETPPSPPRKDRREISTQTSTPTSPHHQQYYSSIQTSPKPSATSPKHAQNGSNLTDSHANRLNRGSGLDNSYKVEITPGSPPSPGRPNSVKRFLSRRSLLNDYNSSSTSQENIHSPQGGFRPESPSPSLASTSRGRKSGSWFKRLSLFGDGGGEGKNRRRLASVVWEEEKLDEPVREVSPVMVKEGPPAPKLPKLSDFKAGVDEHDEGSLGGEELFKNIR